MLQLWPTIPDWLRAIFQTHWWTKPEWWSAIGTVLAVWVALFGETVWACIRRPKLDLSISVRQPDCVKTTLTDESGQVVADCYYFRVLVRNDGKRIAKDVELYAEKLEREEGGKFTPVAQFPPMDFRWSHVGRPLQSISPGLKKHCDLGYVAQPKATTSDELLDQIFDPTVQFCFELEVKANQGGWQIGAGTYRLHVALAAANASVQRRVLEILFDGQWRDEEKEMFDGGVQIKVI